MDVRLRAVCCGASWVSHLHLSALVLSLPAPAEEQQRPVSGGRPGAVGRVPGLGAAAGRAAAVRHTVRAPQAAAAAGRRGAPAQVQR